MYLRQELTRAARLGNVGVATRCACRVSLPGQRIRSYRDDGDRSQYRVSLEAAGSLITVNARQLNIHENEVRPMRRRRSKSRLAVRRLDDLEISAREQIPQDLPIVQLIFDHQDAPAHDGPLAFRPAPAA